MKLIPLKDKVILQIVPKEEKVTKSGIVLKETEAQKKTGKFIVYACWENIIPKGNKVLVPKYGLWKLDIIDPDNPDMEYYSCDIHEIPCIVKEKAKD